MTNINDIDDLTLNFKMKYERFKKQCDSVQRVGMLDKCGDGSLKGFYGYDLATVALRLIAADGVININEVRYYNELFDFEYTSQELLELYRGCSDMLLGDYFESDFSDAFTRLRGISPSLAIDYKELLGYLCEIIISSDGEVTDDEVEEVETLKSLCR